MGRIAFCFVSLRILFAKEACIDDDQKIAELAAANNMKDISSCADVLAGCTLNDKRGENVRKYCCETCAANTAPSVPIQNDYPPTDEIVQVFLLSGQSECKGQARSKDLNENAEKYPNLQGDLDHLWFAGYDKVDNEESFFMATMNGSRFQSFGPELSFGERIRAVTLKRTMIVKYCVGGTNVHTHWNPDTASNGWDKDSDDGTAQWMMENAGLDFSSKDSLFKNMVYTIRKTEEVLEAEKIPFAWAGIVWLQGAGDKLVGDPVWKEFGRNTARVWDGFRDAIGKKVPIIDTGAATYNDLKSGKEYATKIVCKAKNVEFAVAANDDTASDCIVSATNPCTDAANMHRNLRVPNFYGYDPNIPDEMKPANASDKLFAWYVKYPTNVHSAYEGMILKGRMLANAFIREFSNLALEEKYLVEDPVVQFPWPRCDDGVLPTAEKLCWIDYRDKETEMVGCDGAGDLENMKPNEEKQVDEADIKEVGEAGDNMITKSLLLVLVSFFF